jgi:hypothetical protein
MDPLDFLEVARELKDRPEESFRRTSIGRSYYAVFLFFRDYLDRNGVKKLDPAREIHPFVTICLRKSGVEIGNSIGKNLLNLKQSRVDADYDSEGFSRPGMASDVYELAKETVGSFRKAIDNRTFDEKELIKNAKIEAAQPRWSKYPSAKK